MADEKESGYVQDLAKGRLQQARDDLKSAQLNFSAGLLKAANNRAYYAIFHAVAAVLSLENVAFKRHKDTIAYFNNNYVRTEVFPRKIGRMISEAQEIRHASDYDVFYIAVKSDTEEQIAAAEEIIHLVEEYLEKDVSKPGQE